MKLVLDKQTIENCVTKINNLVKEGDYTRALEYSCLLTKECIKRNITTISVARLFNIAGLVNKKLAHYKKADELYNKSLKILEECGLKYDKDYIIILNNLALLYHCIGKLDESEEIFNSIINLKKEKNLDNTSGYATNLDNLASVYQSKGMIKESYIFFEEALTIRITILGEECSKYIENGRILLRDTLSEDQIWAWENYAISLNNIGNFFRLTGNYNEAEKKLLESNEIRKELFSENSIQYSITQNNLGQLYLNTAAYDKSRDFLFNSLRIRKEILGIDHPDYLDGLNSIASLLHSVGEYQDAKILFDELIRVQRPNKNKKSLDFANLLDHAGVNSIYTRNYQESEKHLKESLKILKKKLGKNHHIYAQSVNNLGFLYLHTGNRNKAIQYYQESLGIIKGTFGDFHPYYANSLGSFASLLVTENNQSEAHIMMRQASNIYDNFINQVFSFGSDSHKRSLNLALTKQKSGYLSFLLIQLPETQDNLIEAYNFVLRRKCIEIESSSNQREKIYRERTPHLVQKINELSSIKNQIIEVTFTGYEIINPDKKSQILEELRQKQELIESELTRSIPEIDMMKKSRDSDYHSVRKSLPQNSVILEFIKFYEYDFHAIPSHGEKLWKDPHYFVFVVQESSDILSCFDLGIASNLEPLVKNYLNSLSNENSDPTLLGYQLSRLLIECVKDKISSCSHLFIAPDGILSILPFETLPYDTSSLLIDQFSVSYLGVGRDILKFDQKIERQNEPIIIANPDYNLNLQSGSATQSNRQILNLSLSELKNSLLMRDEIFAPLPGTQKEGIEISSILNTIPYLDKNALESKIKYCSSPSIIHLATHGFFFGDCDIDCNNFSDRSIQFEMRSPDPYDKIQTISEAKNPLIRSGLAFAGAETWLNGGLLPPEAEDGILTAEDITGIDLIDTELVNLSACQTGLGEIKTGEGVFGFRYSFSIAGARTLIMSLWNVPDQETQELMIHYYRELQSGKGRSEALRNAQLLIKSRTNHPYFWGAFICQGDIGILSFKF
ncbi:MAG: CHAT domain-containing protein [Methanomicrobiales archaeon]|nr:CHAT domain-containing protein [Methanomicrobiales archaeon]